MTPVDVPQNWDYEADVLVIGGGTTGLPAAIVAAEAGVKATVLESRGTCGGSFKMVVGGFAIAGSDEQKEQGIDDSPELYYQDMVNLCGTDPDIARAFADNQLDAYKMLKEQGIKFPGLTALPGHSRIYAYQQTWHPARTATGFPPLRSLWQIFRLRYLELHT